MRRLEQLTIGQRSFETRNAARRFVDDLLYAQPLKVAIPEPHHSFLTALISMHPHVGRLRPRLRMAIQVERMVQVHRPPFKGVLRTGRGDELLQTPRII